MTRILDINDVELQEENLDLEAGYLQPDRLFVQHHDEVEAQERQFHYTVKAFYFDDGSSVEIESEDDPRIGIDDAEKGLFHYEPLAGENARKLRGIDLKEIEDVPAVAGQAAWDEYEDIQRYIEYTEEELEAKAAQEAAAAEAAERAAARETFLETAPERLNDAEDNIEEANGTIEDLILIMADLVGTEEE